MDEHKSSPSFQATAIVYVQTMNLKKVPSNAVFGSWVAHRLVVHLWIFVNRIAPQPPQLSWAAVSFF